MARLVNTRTGVTVSVSGATAARLGAEYEPVAVGARGVEAETSAPRRSTPDPKPEPKRRAPARKRKTVSS